MRVVSVNHARQNSIEDFALVCGDIERVDAVLKGLFFYFAVVHRTRLKRCREATADVVNETGDDRLHSDVVVTLLS
jgi:hypothetical protein